MFSFDNDADAIDRAARLRRYDGGRHLEPTQVIDPVHPIADVQVCVDCQCLEFKTETLHTWNMERMLP